MTRLTPEDADRIVGGLVDATDPDLGPLAAFASDVRRTFGGAPDAGLRAAHLTVMAEAAEAVAGTGAAVRSATRALRFRRSAVRGLVAAAGVVSTSVVLAATGTLGAPARSVVADAARLAGVELQVPETPEAPAARTQASGRATTEAQVNRERALLFTTAKQEWTSCVAERASEKEGGPFDPEADPPEGCGPKPLVEAAAANRISVQRTPNPAGHVPGAGDAGIEEGNVGMEGEITVTTTTAPEDVEDSHGGSKGGNGNGNGNGRSGEGDDADAEGSDTEARGRFSLGVDP